MNVNIKSLVINVNFGGVAQSVGTASGRLADLLSKLFAQKEEATPAAETDGKFEAKHIDTDAIKAFIASGPGGVRSLTEIVEKFDHIPSKIVASVMSTLAAFGMVRHEDFANDVKFSLPADGESHDDVAAANAKARDEAAPQATSTAAPTDDVENGASFDAVLREAGVVSFGAGGHDDAEVVAGPGNADAPIVDTHNLVGFLRSHHRFTMRTVDAIERNLPGSAATLKGAIDAGIIGTKRRRSDGATLYYVVPNRTIGNLVSFLHSSDRYTMRSIDAIAKHFITSEANVCELLADAMGVHAVVSKRQRRTGNTLYKAIVASWADAVPEAVAAPEDLATPELNVVNLRSFLTSDARYNLRSKAAIATHFGVSTDSEELGALLSSAENDGDITAKIRRADRATMYAAA